MKKQFTLLLVTLLGMLGFAANASRTFTVIVQGEGSLAIQDRSGSTSQQLVVGEQSVTMPWDNGSLPYCVLVPSSSTEIESLKSVYVEYGTTYDNYLTIDKTLGNGKWDFGPIYDGDIVTITIKSSGEKPTVKTTVLDLLSDANVEVYYSEGTNFGRAKKLQKGKNVVEIPMSTYFIAAIGVTNTSDLVVKANGEGNPLYVNGSAPFDSGNGVSVRFSSATAAASYTIEVAGQTEVPQTKNFTINLTGKAVLKYNTGSADWQDYELSSGVNNVSLPANVSSINVLALDDYVLESCVSKEGVTISPTKSYSFPGFPNVFKIPVDNLSASYTIVTKKPVKTIVLDVLTVDADIVLFNGVSWYKDKTLAFGENTVEIPAAKYYIVANGVKNPARLVVKDPDGQELPVKDYNSLASGTAGVYVEFESATAPAKYTIEVKEEAPEPTTYDFTVNLTGKALIKYQDASNGFVNVPLNEGANAIQIPRTVTTFYFVADEGYELVSCNDLSLYVSELGNTYRVFTASLAGTYTLVTKEKAPEPTPTTFTLNVDNPARVTVMNQSYRKVDLVAGENVINPEEVTSITISAAYNAPKPIYSCTLDGEPLEFVNNAYRVNPTKAGQVIDIVTEWPDVKYTVDLAYTNAQGVWTSASVGDPDFGEVTPVEIVDNKITVDAGVKLNLYSDEINKYNFNTLGQYGNAVVIGINGEELNIVPTPGEANVSFFVTKSGTVTTDATKKIDIPVTINIDGNPADIRVKYGSSTTPPYQYQLIPDLKTGANTFTVSSDDIISVTALNEADVTMTYKVAGDAEVKSPAAPDYSGAVYTEAFTGLGAEVNITITGGTGPVYDKEFAVNIDGFGGKLMYRPLTGGYESFRSLEPGLNNVGLTAEDQKLIGGLLYIVPADGWDFTECTDADGNPITILSSNAFPSYVDVNTYNPRSEYNFKGVSTDKDVTLTLEGPADFWTKILVNKNEVTPEDGKLTIRYNDMVELYNEDIAAWKVNSIVDPATGRPVYISGNTEYPILAFNIKGDWTLTVDAHRLAIYDVTVNVTTANLVRLRKGTTNVTLRNGENTIQVSELDTDEFYVSLRDADKGYIVAVQSQANADAELVPAEFEAGVYTIARFDGEGGLLNIDVQAEAEALVYTDKATNLIDCKENAIALEAGYNHVALHYADAPFAFEGEPAVYVNYEALEGGLTLRADDVCKAFYEAAQPLTVTFTVAPAEEGQAEADAAFGNVTRDYVTPVADVTAPFTVMPGTFLSFMTVTAEGLEYEVTINGEKVEGVENVYTTTITADTEIKLVYNNPGNGIVTIGRDQLDLNAVYFDLAGRRIDARNIAAGIYIRVAGNTATKIAVK